jgi:hypothetical protein
MKRSHERQIIEAAERALDFLAAFHDVSDPEHLAVEHQIEAIKNALIALSRLEEFRAGIAAQLFHVASDLQDIAERNDR